MAPTASTPDLPQTFWEVEAAKSSAVIKALWWISWANIPWALVGLPRLTPELQFIFFLQLVELVPDSMQHLKWPLKIVSAAGMEVGKEETTMQQGKTIPNNSSASFNSWGIHSSSKNQNKIVFKNVLSVSGTTLNFGFPKFFSNSRGDRQKKYVKFTCLL